MFNSQYTILLIIFIALFLVVLFLDLFIQRIKKMGLLTRSLNMSLFLITMPIERLDREKSSPDEFKKIIGVMEQFYASLAGLLEKGFWHNFIYGQPYLSFEIAIQNIGEEITFYLAAPKKYQDLIEK